MPNKLQSKRLNSQGQLGFADIVDAVSNHFCLPAIQRGVVWSKEDIASFFDSLFKGFPVGNLLLWELKTSEDRNITVFYPINTREATTAKSRRIYNFNREENKRFCVIDGQQRITALYRGLNNAYVVDGRRYYLYFNLLYNGTESSAFKYYNAHGNGFIEEKHLWMPVKLIWENYTQSIMSVLEHFLTEFSEKDSFYKTVRGEKVRKTTAEVRRVDSIIEYYRQNQQLAEKNLKAFSERLLHGGLPYMLVDLNSIQTSDEKIEKLFDVFVRLNKNGRPLNPTDLLFAQLAKSSSVDRIWELFDETVSQINDSENGVGKKSKFSQDNLLRFIWLAKRRDNASFSRFFMTQADQVQIDQEEMDKIKTAFKRAKEVYIKGHFTFDRYTPYSMFLPIAYYFYYGGRKTAIATAEIERYYEVALVSEAFGQHTDTVMSKISDTFGKNNRNNITLFGNREFCFTQLQKNLKENGASFFEVSTDMVDSILKKTYITDRDSIKQILFLLSRKKRPDTTIEYDVDHMHPKKLADPENESIFFDNVGSKETRTEELYKYYKEHVNDLPNLQLLDEYGNRGEKNDKPLVNWLKEYRRPNNLHEYAVNNYVCGDDTPDGEPDITFFELRNFEEFFTTRKEVLRKALLDFFEIYND